MKPKDLFIAILLILIIGAVFVFYQKMPGRVRFDSSILLSEVNPAAEGFSLQDSEEYIDTDEEKLTPDIIKAVYLTSWSAGRESKINYVINLAKTTEINAVVIDIKDFSGYVAYDTKAPEAVLYNAKQIRIPDIDYLIQRLHREKIYVIARIVVFQDPVLARARPDLAIYQKYGLSSFLPLLAAFSFWLDNLKLAWVDPSSKEVWDYNIAIARDAAERGFDELNFDYIRFPSDGNLKAMGFPLWKGEVPRSQVIREFFKELRRQLPDVKISVDLFGLTTINYDDLGVGQIIEDAYESFDYVCPMVYPSHYARGFLGYQNPADYPYAVVKYSLEKAKQRLVVYRQSFETDEKKINAQLRPWLQDFDLRAFYNAQMVGAQIEAAYDALGEDFKGFMIWNPLNIYQREALEQEK